jgi:hypothetical protein
MAMHTALFDFWAVYLRAPEHKAAGTCKLSSVERVQIMHLAICVLECVLDGRLEVIDDDTRQFVAHGSSVLSLVLGVVMPPDDFAAETSEWMRRCMDSGTVCIADVFSYDVKVDLMF